MDVPYGNEWLNLDIERYVKSIQNGYRNHYKDLEFAQAVDKLQQLAIIEYEILESTCNAIEKKADEEKLELSTDTSTIQVQCYEEENDKDLITPPTKKSWFGRIWTTSTIKVQGYEEENDDDLITPPPKKSMLARIWTLLLLLFSCSNHQQEEITNINQHEQLPSGVMSEEEEQLWMERLQKGKMKFVHNMMRIARTSMVAPD